MGDSDLYVYAVLRWPTDLPPDPLGMGIDGAPLQLVHVPEGLTAIVHETTSGPYEGSDDDAKRWILEHSAVVERAWEAAGNVLPVTFNVLVRADGDRTAYEALRGWLRDTAPEVRSRLDALRDRVELRVDISLDRRQAAEEEPDVQALAADLADKPPGVRRLLVKKLEKLQRDAAENLADALYPDYRRRLAGLVDDITENRRGARVEEQVRVLAAAVLVHRDRVQQLGAELSRIQNEQQAARIRFLGPWPPYSFSELPPEAATDRSDEGPPADSAPQ